MHKRTCKNKKKTFKRNFFKNRRKTYKGKKSRKAKGRNKKGRRILRGGNIKFDMSTYLDKLQIIDFKLSIDPNDPEYDKCIFVNNSTGEIYDIKTPIEFTPVKYQQTTQTTQQRKPYKKEAYFERLCTSNRGFLKTKFESLFLNVTDLLQVNNQVKPSVSPRPTTRTRVSASQPVSASLRASAILRPDTQVLASESAINLYAKAIYEKHKSFEHFTEVFQHIAVNLYNNHAYIGIDIDKKPKKAIILGPIELLYPFTSSTKFAVLSTNFWTQNFNFNFIMDILTDIGEFFMIIPTENTITNLKSELSSNCNIIDVDKVQERATLKELLLLMNLQTESKININILQDDLTKKIHTETTEHSHKSTNVVKESKPKKHENSGIEFIEYTKSENHYSVNHYIHKFVAFEHAPEKPAKRTEHTKQTGHTEHTGHTGHTEIIANLIKSYEHAHHHHLHDAATAPPGCTNKAACNNIVPIEEAIEKKNDNMNIILNPYNFYILHITRKDNIKPYLSPPNEDNLINVLESLPLTLTLDDC